MGLIPEQEFDLDEATDEIARRYGVPTAVWKKMTGVESGDDPNAVSPKKAAGRWQLMPETARNLGVKMGDPLSEAEGALRYLRDNYKAVSKYAKNEKHKWMAAIAGYHGPLENVLKNFKKGGNGIPDQSDGYITTRDHVLKIFDGLDGVYDRSPLGTPETKTNGGGVRTSGTIGGTASPVSVTVGGKSVERYASDDEIAAYEKQFGKLPAGAIPKATPTFKGDIAKLPPKRGYYERREIGPGFSGEYYEFEKTGTTKDGNKYLGMVDGKYRFETADGSDEIEWDPVTQTSKSLSPPKPFSLKTTDGNEYTEEAPAAAPSPQTPSAPIRTLAAGQRRLYDKKTGKPYIATAGETKKDEAGNEITNWSIVPEGEDAGPKVFTLKTTKGEVFTEEPPKGVDPATLPPLETGKRRLWSKKTGKPVVAVEGEKKTDDDGNTSVSYSIESEGGKPTRQTVTQKTKSSVTVADEAVSHGVEQTGRLKLGDGTELKLIRDEATPEGFLRLRDADNETYLFDKSTGKISDESLAQPAKTYPLNLIPRDQRLAVPVSAAQENQARQLAPQIAGDYGIDAEDAYFWLLKRGFTDITTGQPLPDERYYQSAEAQRAKGPYNQGKGADDTYSLTRRDLREVVAYSLAEKKRREDAILQMIERGDEPTQATLSQYRVNLADLTDKRRDEYQMALVKGKVSAEQLGQTIPKFMAQGYDPIESRILAKKQLGHMRDPRTGQDMADAEIAAYREEKAAYLAKWAPQNEALAQAGLTEEGYGAMPRSQLIARDATAYLAKEIAKYGSPLGIQEVRHNEERAEADRVKRLEGHAWGRWALETYKAWTAGVAKSTATGVGDMLEGFAVYVKPVADYFDTLLLGAPKDVEDTPTFQLGKRIKEFAQGWRTDADYDKNYLQGIIPHAFGSSLAFMPAAAAGPLGIVAAATAQMAGADYEEALKLGATKDEAARFARIDATLFGWTEMLGFGSAFRRFLKGSTNNTWRHMAFEAFKEGAEEIALNEVPQSVGNNILASVTIEPMRSWDKGVFDAFVGAGSSAPLASILVSALLHGKNRGRLQSVLRIQSVNGSPYLQNLGEGGLLIHGKPQPITPELRPIVDMHSEIAARISDNFDAIEKMRARAQVLPAEQRLEIFRTVRRVQQDNVELFEKQSQVAAKIVEKSGVPAPDVLEQKDAYDEVKAATRDEQLEQLQALQAEKGDVDGVDTSAGYVDETANNEQINADFQPTHTDPQGRPVAVKDLGTKDVAIEWADGQRQAVPRAEVEAHFKPVSETQAEEPLTSETQSAEPDLSTTEGRFEAYKAGRRKTRISQIDAPETAPAETATSADETGTKTEPAPPARPQTALEKFEDRKLGRLGYSPEQKAALTADERKRILKDRIPRRDFFRKTPKTVPPVTLKKPIYVQFTTRGMRAILRNSHNVARLKKAGWIFRNVQKNSAVVTAAPEGMSDANIEAGMFESAAFNIDVERKTQRKPSNRAGKPFFQGSKRQTLTDFVRQHGGIRPDAAVLQREKDDRVLGRSGQNRLKDSELGRFEGIAGIVNRNSHFTAAEMAAAAVEAGYFPGFQAEHGGDFGMDASEFLAALEQDSFGRGQILSVQSEGEGSYEAQLEREIRDEARKDFLEAAYEDLTESEVATLKSRHDFLEDDRAWPLFEDIEFGAGGGVSAENRALLVKIGLEYGVEKDVTQWIIETLESYDQRRRSAASIQAGAPEADVEGAGARGEVSQEIPGAEDSIYEDEFGDAYEPEDAPEVRFDPAEFEDAEPSTGDIFDAALAELKAEKTEAAKPKARDEFDEIAKVMGFADEFNGEPGDDIPFAAELSADQRFVYAKLKDHFESAYSKQEGDAAARMKAFIGKLNERFSVEQIEKLKPYIVAFVEEKTDGKQSAETGPIHYTKTGEPPLSIEEIYSKPNTHLYELLHALEDPWFAEQDKREELNAELKKLEEKKKAVPGGKGKKERLKPIQDEIDAVKTQKVELENAAMHEQEMVADELAAKVISIARAKGHEVDDQGYVNDEGDNLVEDVWVYLTDGRYMEGVYHKWSVQKLTDALIDDFFSGELVTSEAPEADEPERTEPPKRLDQPKAPPTQAESESGPIAEAEAETSSTPTTTEERFEQKKQKQTSLFENPPETTTDERFEATKKPEREAGKVEAVASPRSADVVKQLNDAYSRLEKAQNRMPASWGPEQLKDVTPIEREIQELEQALGKPNAPHIATREEADAAMRQIEDLRAEADRVVGDDVKAQRRRDTLRRQANGLDTLWSTFIHDDLSDTEIRELYRAGFPVSVEIADKIADKSPDTKPPTPATTTDTADKVEDKKADKKEGDSVTAAEQQPGEVYHGKAYRAESNLISGGKTALDVVNFEGDELGNEDTREEALRIAKKLSIDLADVKARDVIWVTDSKDAAEKYLSREVDDTPIGEVNEIEIPEGSIILTADGENGYLVLTKPLVSNEVEKPATPAIAPTDAGTLFDMGGLDEEGLFAQGGPTAESVPEADTAAEDKEKTKADLIRRQAEADRKRRNETFGEETSAWLSELLKDTKGKSNARDAAIALNANGHLVRRAGGPGQDFAADAVAAMLEAHEAEIRGLSYDDYIRQAWLGKEDLTDKQREIYDTIAAGDFSSYVLSELNDLPEVKNDAASERGGLAQDRPGVGRVPDAVREEVSDAAGVEDDGGASDVSDEPQETRPRPAGDNSLFGSGPVVSGERGDQSVRPQAPADQGSDTGVSDDGRSGAGYDERASAEYKPSDAVREEAERTGSDVKEKRVAQAAAENIEVAVGDLANIRRTLPFLLPEQQDDVAFAERRFSSANGVLFTNATGTGKTYTGLGIVKRYAKQGKDNIIVVAPNDKILEDWRTSALNLHLDIRRLGDTMDNGGRGIVATTYANFRANKELLKRKWDLIIFDEAHNLSQNKDGDLTASVDMLRAVALHPRGEWSYHNIRNAEKIEEVAGLAADKRRLEKRQWRVSYEERPAVQAQLRAADERLKAARAELEDLRKEAEAEFAERRKTETPSKVTFLSATPFAYEKNIEYAEGYLFEFGPEPPPGGYNTPTAREQFFIEHFGYRMRYGKLTKPDVDVNTERMEQLFNAWLQRQGALSGRKLDVDVDYSRQFVVIESAIGSKIDEGFEYLSRTREPNPKGGYDIYVFRHIEEILRKRFNYLARRFTLEAINARASIPIIRQHLELGRKVVVFHDYNKNEAVHPFNIDDELRSGELTLAPTVQAEYERFKQERLDVFDLDLSSLEVPSVLLTSEFGPQLVEFNGTVPTKARRKAVEDFNRDDSEVKILLAQSDAGREGISLHDTTGKHQRVLINLGLPVRPIAAVQTEGRIYRVGTRSDAIQIYITTGTNFERYAFGTTISQRAATAENLAMGLGARALRQAFIDGYEDAQPDYAAHADEGKGGKEADRAGEQALADVSEFEWAKTYYFGQGKKTSRNKSAEGKDYFATPEPLGLKMVEWADQQMAESSLEPSAGHGAIARFFRTDNRKTVIEPSSDLSSRLALVTDGRILQEAFEEHHVGANKYATIVMNPPFGAGGKTAMDHVEKAVKHLDNGGRVVALIPSGPAMDKRLEKFLASDEAKSIFQIADIKLPSVTFKRAATQVATHVIVLEKQLWKADQEKLATGDEIDLSHHTDINEFFDELEDISVDGRTKPGSSYEPHVPSPQPGTPAATPEYLTPEQTELANDSSPFDKKQFNHTKTGEAIYVAKLKERDEVNFSHFRHRIAPRYGGYYSKYSKGGAIAGFHFKTPENRDAFIAEAEAYIGTKPLQAAIVTESAAPERVTYTPPYTTTFLQNDQFKNLAGRAVKVDTIRQVLKQQSVKAIEREIVEAVLAMPDFAEQASISFDAFREAVQLELLPLRVIESSSYSQYGVDNTGIYEMNPKSFGQGDGSAAETQTHIFNTDLDHGITGHFSGDFQGPADGERIVSYHDAAENRMVTRSVRDWEIVERDNNGRAVFLVIQEGSNPRTEDELQAVLGTVTNSREKAQEWIDGIGSTLRRNKGMFGHTRVAYAGDKGIIIELQSDVYQKHRAEELVLSALQKEADRDGGSFTGAEAGTFKSLTLQYNRAVRELAGKYTANVTDAKRRLEGAQDRLGREQNAYAEFEALLPAIDRYTTRYRELLNGDQAMSFEAAAETLADEMKADDSLGVLSSDVLEELKQHFQHAANTETFILNLARMSELDILRDIDMWQQGLVGLRQRVKDYENIIRSGEYKEFLADEKAVKDARAALLAALPLKYKQFIAHRKNYTARLLREEVRQMALKGLKEVWIVTPRTAALVEGFLRGEEGNGELPYELKDDTLTELSIGDRILHAGDEYVVIESDSDDITVANLDDVDIADADEWRQNEISKRQGDVLRHLRTEFGEGKAVDPAAVEQALLDEGLRGNDAIDVLARMERQGDKVVYHWSDAEEAFRTHFNDTLPTLNDYLYSLPDAHIWHEFAGSGTYIWAEDDSGQPRTLQFRQPGKYDRNADVEAFDINEFSGYERTILDKYVELNTLVKAEFENVEIKTDPRGNEYLGFPIPADTIEKGVKLFSRLTTPQAAVSELGFYSGVEQAILEKMPERASAAQIRGILKDQKAEELEWLGIEQFLDEKDSFAKDEVLGFVRANNLSISEHVLADDEAKYSPDLAPKLTLPGGENYREVLLSLPMIQPEVEPVDSSGWTVRTIKDYPYTGQRHIEVLNERGQQIAQSTGYRGTDEEMIESVAQHRLGSLQNSAAKLVNFKSPHYPKPWNVFAHFRADDRYIDGKKYLHAAEWQSDIVNEIKRLEGLAAEGKLEDVGLQRIETLKSLMPFKKSWPMLLVKRAIRYAVEHGYDGISWDTGETNAERYDLRQAFDAIDYKTTDGVKHVGIDLKEDNLRVEFTLDEENRVVGSNIAHWDGKDIDAVFGKGIAKEVLDNESGTIAGDGLKIGGEGKLGLYDKMVPNETGKYVKQWGARVDSAILHAAETHEAHQARFERTGEFVNLSEEDLAGRDVSIHKIDFTPQMKTSVASGQKLFAMRTEEAVELMTNVLPKAHTSVMLAGIKSTITDEGELETTPHAMHTTMLILNEIDYREYKEKRAREGADAETIDREFDETHGGRSAGGFVASAADLREMAAVGRETRIDYSRAGYTDEDLAGYDELIENFEQLAVRAEDYGIVYAFDEHLPEERFHVDDLRAGRTDQDALRSLEGTALWQNPGTQFLLEYPRVSPADKASELAAKLATGQAEKYGWDKRPDFEKEKQEFLDLWYDGVLRRNAAFIEANGIDAFTQRYRRIYAAIKAGNTGESSDDKRGKRTGGGAQGKSSTKRSGKTNKRAGPQQAQSDRSKKQRKLSVDEERKYAEALGVDPAQVRIKLRRHADLLRDRRGLDVPDVAYAAGTDVERIAEVKDILRESLLAADDSGFTQGDYDQAIEVYLNPDTHPRTRSVLGDALIEHLFAAGELELGRDIAERNIRIVGEAAQALQTASIVAKYDFAHGVKLAIKALRSNGKEITQEQVDEIKKWTQKYNASQREKALISKMLADAEELIAEQQAELDEANRALAEAAETLGGSEQERAEMAAALEESEAENAEKDGLIENLKRQVARWKAKKMSPSVVGVSVSRTYKALEAEMPAIKDALAKAFPGKVLKSAITGQPQTETPEFKKWFGDSKVVDAGGKPLVVYHGTKGQFDVFDTSGSVRSGIGSMFTADREYAENYGRPEYGGRIIDAYLHIENPFDARNEADRQEYKTKRKQGESLVEYAKRSGRDGAITLLDEYVAFAPTQIKSAIGNRGTFDPKDPSILKAALTADNFDDETRENIVKYIAYRIFEGDSPKETLDTIGDLTDGVLNADEIRAIHYDAEKMTHGDKKDGPSAETVAKQKNRRDHARAAKAYAQDAGIGESQTERNVKAATGAEKLNKLDREILELAGDDEQLGAAAIFYNKAKSVDDWYKAIESAFPDLNATQQADLFVRARKLRDEARDSLKASNAKRRGLITDIKGEYAEYERQELLTRAVARKHKATLDALYKRMTKSDARRRVDTALDIASTPKTMMSTGEVSFVGRQGFLPLLLFTGGYTKDGKMVDGAVKGLLGTIKGFQSDANRAIYEEKLRQHRHFDRAVYNGTIFSQIGDFNLVDEHFAGQAFHKMAHSENVILRGVGKAQLKFEHAYTLPGDAQRLFVSSILFDLIDDQDLAPHERAKADRMASRIANAFTGKSNLEFFKRDNTLTKLINMLGFSPSFVGSRFESALYLSPAGIILAPKGTRGILMRKMVRFHSTMFALAMASLFMLDADGDDDERSPWDIIDPASKSFLKGRIRGTDQKFDLTANMSEPMRLFLYDAVGTAIYAARGDWNKVADIWKQERERYLYTDMGEALRYFRGKLSPTASFVYDVATGKDYLGRDVKTKSDIALAALERLYPLTYKQTIDSLTNDAAIEFMKPGLAEQKGQQWENIKRGELSVRNAAIVFITSALGANFQDFAEVEKSQAEIKAWDMYEGFESKKFTKEQKAVNAGLRKLYRYRDELIRRGQGVTHLNFRIDQITKRYGIDEAAQVKLREQATGSRFAFVTKNMSVDEVKTLLDEYATGKERPELQSILEAKMRAAAKKEAKAVEPAKDLAYRLTYADIAEAAKIYNENSAKFTSEQRFEARKKILAKVLNSHKRNQLSPESYDAAKDILGDEIKFSRPAPKAKRGKEIAGLDTLKGVR